MWGSFFGNLAGRFRSLGPGRGTALMWRSVEPLLRFRAMRWPCQQATSTRISHIQHAMASRILGVTQRPDEDNVSFYRRRDVAAATHIDTWRWHHLHKKALAGWYRHLARRRNADAWASRLLHIHGANWMDSQRSQHSLGKESRTRTRSIRGKVSKRWDESIIANNLLSLFLDKDEDKDMNMDKDND